jgi:alcohol dehydrogenase (cytochrome c)
MRRIFFTALFAALLSVTAVCQELNPDTITNPPADSWPTYHGDYTGRRHSPLTQINPQNVDQLALSWVFQTGQAAGLKCVPLLVNGVLYITVPDHVWAIDARSGHQIWHYTYPPNKGLHIGQRGVAMYRDRLYFLTPDAHLICLNAKDGKPIWNVVVANVDEGYWTSMSPLIVRNHVIVGASGDFDNLRGFLRSIDPETGKTQWEWHATPPPDTPNQPTGGNMWMTGTYDPSLNLVFWGTGNPTPVLTGKTRPGDNLYTCSIVALNPDTGKLSWAFQASPHDTHDWDAAEVPVLVDGEFKGTPHKMLLQASRNGYFFVLDRTTGKNLLTKPFGPVNWAKDIDDSGRPVPNPEKEPAPDGRLIAPDEGGLTNYRSPSVDPKLGLFVVSAHPSYGIYFAKPADGTFGWAGADYGVWGKLQLKAIDYHTGEMRWTHELGPNGAGSGVITTASGLTFTGDALGNLLALSTETGKTLWHAGTGAPIQSSPIIYELDGRQYLVTSSGSVLFAWALPKSAIDKATGPATARR